jgi:creatinine amidohydrolase
MPPRGIRYELLRPDQLRAERERCPLVFLPVGPLEYHGPHMPLGTDPINATQVALRVCEKLQKGVVHPTLFMGTERERSAAELESLGFPPDAWIVGMDFPGCLWKSHYYQEQVFGLLLAGTLELLIEQAYRVVIVVNGHGALNHRATIERLAAHYSHLSQAAVRSFLAFPEGSYRENQVGHADRLETSMLLYHEASVGAGRLVDLSTLPERDTPLHYRDFSIVDAEGFTPNPSPGRIVASDPRDAEAGLGQRLVTETVEELAELTREVLVSRGL